MKLIPCYLKLFSFKPFKMSIVLAPVSLILLWSLSSFANPNLLGNWPENIKISYALEVSQNQGLKSEDFLRMAAIVMSLRTDITLEAAQEKLGKLPISVVKAWALSDFYLEYYDIPLDILKQDIALQAGSKSEINSQIIDRNGIQFVRLFVHPLHTESEIRFRFSRYRGTEKLLGLQTSSRSLLVLEPNRRVYSVKTSLKRANGVFKSKIYLARNAEFHFEMSQIISNDVELNRSFFLEDSFVALRSDTIDEGQIVRDFEPFRNGNFNIALTSILQGDFAQRVARANGFAIDNIDFLEKIVIPELGRVMGILYGRYGLIHNSLHSQNITVSFDKNLKFLGIRVRDPDFDVDINKYEKVFGAVKANRFRELAPRNAQSGTMNIDFSPMNGMYTILNAPDNVEVIAQRLSSAFVAHFAAGVSSTTDSQRSAEFFMSLVRRSQLDVGLSEDMRFDMRFDTENLQGLLDGRTLTEDSIPDSVWVKNPEQTIKDAILNREHSQLERRYQLSSLQVGWDLIIQDFQTKTENSWIIQELRSSANKEKFFRAMVYLSFLFTKSSREIFIQRFLTHHMDDIASLDYGYLLNNGASVEILRLFIATANTRQIDYLWSFYLSNGLFSLPQELFNRWIVRTSPILYDSLKRIILSCEKSPAACELRKDNLQKLIEAVRVRERQFLRQRNSSNISCIKYFDY